MFHICADYLLAAEEPEPLCHAPVIILDDLSKINVSEVFGDILEAIERRGPANAIAIKLGKHNIVDIISIVQSGNKF